MQKVWNKQEQSGSIFEANPSSEHLLARRAEILPQKVVHSGMPRRSKSLLSQLHLMAIMMLYCVQAKLQSSLKGFYNFHPPPINLTKLIVLASFDYLWISLRI